MSDDALHETRSAGSDDESRASVAAWRIEVIGAERYRFLNISGQCVDHIAITAHDDSAASGETTTRQPIEIPGPVDYLLGKHAYTFDQNLPDGKYTLRWRPAGTEAGESRTVRFSVPPLSPYITALLTVSAPAEDIGEDDYGEEATDAPS